MKNAAIQSTKISRVQYTSPRRQQAMGLVFIGIGIFILLFFVRTTPPNLFTTFVMTPGGSDVKAPNLVFNSLSSLIIFASICIILGTYQFIKGLKQYTNLGFGLVGILLVISFLAWGAAGGSINLAGMLSATVISAVPITIGALAGIISERSGVSNIAIEGMMILGAFVAAFTGSILGLGAGMIASMLVGALLAVVHGILSIKYKVNQIISATMINIFATGLTTYMYVKFLQTPELQIYNQSGFFKPVAIPFLSRIPILGPILFNQNIYIYIMFFLVIFMTVILFNTKWGLRLRAVGEHPKAADTLGINVIKIRYIAVILSGTIAGFAGSYFSLGSIGRFEETMTAGRGFIALAAMIFGKWMPVGAMQAGMLFGFSDALATKLSILRFPIPAQFLLMLPYIVTMIVLAGVVGRAQGPAASGIPYEKESL